MYERKIRELIKAEGKADPYRYMLNVVRPIALETLNKTIEKCRDCNLCKNVEKKMPVIGKEACVLVINDYLNESGLPTEDSPEYKLFQKVLRAYNVNEDKIFWINTISCSPTVVAGGQKVSRQPNGEEMNNCKVFIDYVIKVIDPILIITLGGFASSNYIDGSINANAGKWININGVKAIVTYSPGYILQYENIDDPDGLEELKEAFCEHLLKAFLYVQKEYPEFNVLEKELKEKDFM